MAGHLLVHLCDTSQSNDRDKHKRGGDRLGPNSATDSHGTRSRFRVLSKASHLDRADPEKGRFRSFILTSLKFFVGTPKLD